MVHRDPETGQYVADDGMKMAHYADYVFQHVHSEYQVPAGDLPGAFPIQESDIRVIPLDDLLDRQERADLVAIQIHALQASVPGTSSAESGLEARFELRAGVGDELVLNEDRNTGTDQGSSGVVDTRFWDSDSPDVLYFADWTAEGGFGDSTNGLGAGPDQPVLDADIHFPRDFGSCPQFDDRDEITESFYLDDLGGADISDSLVRLDISYTLIFSVHDRD